MDVEQQRMNYADGQPIKLGDRVKLDRDSGGTVVCVIDTGEYSAEFPEAQWGYLKEGVLMEFPTYGLIHCTTVDSDLVLLSRAP